MKPEYLKNLQLENHLTCKKLIDCKTSALALLQIYLRNNPVYQISDLISDEKGQKMYTIWERMNRFCSVRTEKIKLNKVFQVKRSRLNTGNVEVVGVSSVKDTQSTKAKDDVSTAEKEQETV